MKEYRIMQQKGNCKPYSFHRYNSFEVAYMELLKLIHIQENTLNQEYYVKNEFYKNKYPPYLSNIKKYWIEERVVDDWILCTKESAEKKKKDNIIKMRYKE